MREILFRGKRIDNGEWVEGSLVHQTLYYGDPVDRYHIIYDGEFDCDYYNNKIVIPETVGQYTGLTDKNGTKIFEGDIVEICFLGRTTRHLVEFDDEYRCGWFPFACGDGCGCCETDTYSPSDGEVIGNIHDNPELLKGGASDA